MGRTPCGRPAARSLGRSPGGRDRRRRTLCGRSATRRLGLALCGRERVRPLLYDRKVGLLRPAGGGAGGIGSRGLAEEPSAVPTGIGGWLAFPMLGLIMSPISIMAISLSTYVPIFSKGTWEVVTTSGSEAYHPLWAPLLIFEILGNSCLLIFSIVLIVLFFRRHYLLPKLIIIVYAASLAFQGIDFFARLL